MAASFQGFQSLVENSPDAISLINAQGEILYGSASYTKLFGYEQDELLGRDCMEFIHPEDRDDSNRRLQAAIVRPTGQNQWDARVRRKDGQYCWVESTVSNLIQDLEVQAIVMHQRDIHRRMEAQESTQKQAEELAASNLRMEEFAYTVAHDLREPLRAISLYTQMLCQSVQMDSQTKQMANFVIEGANRMSTMITDLLSFASTGMYGPPLPVKLEHTVEQALGNLTLEIQESGAVVVVDELPIVHGSEIHLVRLFQNLISNAIKYRGEQPPRIRISAERRGPAWAIRVKDNGSGIATEHQSQIFRPFVRLASRDVPGTGLGLAVCKRTVESAGGDIWVESELGAGSTFAFTILDSTDISSDPISAVDRLHLVK